MNNSKYRVEHDTIGPIKILKERYWGPQTERALKHFYSKADRMPMEVIHSLAIIKKAAVKANYILGQLCKEKYILISKAADEILSGTLDNHFPLTIWQSGSGTQTNMNVNEVIANRGNKLAEELNIALQKPIHPNDDVNMSQSSNDTFISAMHIAVIEKIEKEMIPILKSLIDSIAKKEKEFNGIIKIGRTHLQDAVPIALSQEFSGYEDQLNSSMNNIINGLNELFLLPIGGTAVGTGINASKQFSELAIEAIREITLKSRFKITDNKFAYIASNDAITHVSSLIRTLATKLFKIANDIRWLSSGPRCGLGELIIPQNEPGSSIMPGKVNPTQCEVMIMATIEIFGYDTSIAFANSQGNFELNACRPIVIYNLLKSIEILSETIKRFKEYLMDGLKANKERIDSLLQNSLMLITPISKAIGYEQSAEIVQLAYKKGISLKEAALELGYISEEEFDLLADPKSMV